MKFDKWKLTGHKMVLKIKQAIKKETENGSCLALVCICKLFNESLLLHTVCVVHLYLDPLLLNIFLNLSLNVFLRFIYLFWNHLFYYHIYIISTMAFPANAAVRSGKQDILRANSFICLFAQVTISWTKHIRQVYYLSM